MNGSSTSGAGSSGWKPTIHLQRVKSIVPATFIFEQRHLKWSLLRWCGALVGQSQGGQHPGECPPDQFTAPMTGSRCIPVRASSITSQLLCQPFRARGVPSLIAVAPPDFHVGSDKEFLLSNYHQHVCLMRQSFNIEEKCRQLAFACIAESSTRTPTRPSGM